MEIWARFGGDVTSFKFENDKTNIILTLNSYNTHIDIRRTFILLCSSKNAKEIMSVVSNHH